MKCWGQHLTSASPLIPSTNKRKDRREFGTGVLYLSLVFTEFIYSNLLYEWFDNFMQRDNYVSALYYLTKYNQDWTASITTLLSSVELLITELNLIYKLWTLQLLNWTELTLNWLGLNVFLELFTRMWISLDEVGITGSDMILLTGPV